MTLKEVVDILGTHLNINTNSNQVEIWIDKFDLVKLDSLNTHIALYSIGKTLQEAKTALIKKIQGKFLIKTRRFENDITSIHVMPIKIFI